MSIRVYTDGPGRYDWVCAVDGVIRFRGDAWSASIFMMDYQKEVAA